jgi:hypothetical protein
MAFPGAQVSRVGPKSIRMANEGARKTMGALNDGLTVGPRPPTKVMAILAACTWLKMPSGNATMAMPLGRDPIGGGVGL